MSKVHFIGIHKQWDLAGAHHGNQSVIETNRLAFVSSLPDIIIHPLAISDVKISRDSISKECNCDRYCWQKKDAPWLRSTAQIGSFLGKGIDAYSLGLGGQRGIDISPETDFSTTTETHLLPIVPDVAIQYRCGDNIDFSYVYGILPFHVFPNKIPPDTKYVYVLSDHPSRAAHSPYSGRCQTILQSLFDYLVNKLPNVTVVVKRGGNLFLDFIRLSKANITICSASTFCLWPAVYRASTLKKIVYFPYTVLVAGADDNKTAPDLGEYFKWIPEPLISRVGSYRPWTKVIPFLKGESE